MLLTTDLHLTDNPADAYRFEVFDALLEHVEHNEDIVILGDLADRKDRHSAQLVNDIVYQIGRLTKATSRVVILLGNHDMPIEGPPFWNVLNEMEGVKFIIRPYIHSRMAFFPYTKDASDWLHMLDSNPVDVIYMHQTVTGAVVENGRVMTNDRMPKLPRGIPIYSGDIHVPQCVGPVTYVGSPHPIKFGDDHPYRILRLNEDNFSIQKEIILSPPAKRIVSVSSIADLRKIKVAKGDQVRIRYETDAANATDWPKAEAQIAEWAAKQAVTLVSTEVTLLVDSSDQAGEPASEPADIVREYGERQGLAPDIVAAGVTIAGDAAEGFQPRQGAGKVAGKGLRKIELVGVDLEGITSFTQPTHIDFDQLQGLCLLTGKNEVEPDLGANGCGKSSIWNAIRYVLYGGRAGGPMTSWGCKRGFGEVELAINGEQYLISRSTKPEKLLVGGHEVSQETVNELLRLNEEQHDQAITFGQGAKLFYDLSQPARAELFDQVLNLGIWLAASQQAGTALKDHDAAMGRQEREKAFIEGELNGLASETDLTDKSRKWEATRKERIQERLTGIDRLAKEIDKAAALVKVQQSALAELDKEVAHDNVAIKSLSDQKAEASAAYIAASMELSRLERELAAVDKWGPKCGVCQQKILPKYKRDHVTAHTLAIKDHKVMLEKKKAAVVHAEKLVHEAEDAKAVSVVAAQDANRVRNNAVMAHANLERDFDSMERSLTEIEKEVDPYDAMLAELRDRRADAVRRLAAVNLASKRMAGERIAIAYWVTGFKKLRAYLTERILASLTVEVQSAAGLLGLKDWVISFEHDAEAVRPAIHIRTENRNSPDGWGSWSGGETQRLRLAVTLGMANLIRRMAGVWYNWECWDEPCTYLSDEGVEDLLACLDYRATSSGRMIWLTEHRALTYAGFAEVRQVRKTPEGALIETLATG